MASYNTVPAAEEPLLQAKKSSRKHVVLAALASFALGALAVTAVSTKSTKVSAKEVELKQGTCDPYTWPDLDKTTSGGGAVCGACKALVRWNDYGSTCDGYCSGIGLTCVNGWEEEDEGCDVKQRIGCDGRVDTSDAICECAVKPPCDPYTWPDLDKTTSGGGAVCGACKALVRWNDYGSTCHGYCSGIGLTCVDGWEEEDEGCDVMYRIGCYLSADTSDAICECE